MVRHDLHNIRPTTSSAERHTSPSWTQRFSGRSSSVCRRPVSSDVMRTMMMMQRRRMDAPTELTCTCDDIHPARAESASMALTASRTAANQARRSWARSIASDAHSLFHLRMPTTAGPMSRTRFSFSVAAQDFSCPPGSLRQTNTASAGNRLSFCSRWLTK